MGNEEHCAEGGEKPQLFHLSWKKLKCLLFPSRELFVAQKEVATAHLVAFNPSSSDGK